MRQSPVSKDASTRGPVEVLYQATGSEDIEHSACAVMRSLVHESPTALQLLTCYIYKHLVNHVRFEVFTEMTMKNGIFCDVMPCGSCKNKCFGGN
jgi:hypothetical protein